MRIAMSMYGYGYLVPEVLVPPYKLRNLYEGTAGGTQCESHFHADLPFENLQNRFYAL
jgi:hypothetical protein